MANRKASSNATTTSAAKNQQFIAIGVLIAVLIAAVAVILGLRPQAASVDGAINAKIDPAGYQSQFVAAAQDHLLVDVRTPDEYASGHIAGSVNIPVDQLASRLGELPTDKPIVVYCRSGNRSNQAASILGGAGYSSIYDLGGIIAWQNAGYPLQ